MNGAGIITRKSVRLGEALASRVCDSIQNAVILSEAEEPLTFSVGSGGAEHSSSAASTSTREKLEVLRLRSLPPSPAGNSAQNDRLYDAPLRGIGAPPIASPCAGVDVEPSQPMRIFGKTLMVAGTVGLLGSTAIRLLIRQMVLND